jgi:small subunit ribosomal protein S10
MLQISIKSFKQNILNIYVKFLENLFKKLLLKYSLFNIPTKKRKITLLKSPHVHKKAREQFQLNMYKKTIYIKNFKNINYLNNFILNKPKLININIKHIGK